MNRRDFIQRSLRSRAATAARGFPADTNVNRPVGGFNRLLAVC
jgi:hypothetical protein